MRDVFTDLTASPEKLNLEGLPPDSLVSNAKIKIRWTSFFFYDNIYTK